MWSWMRVRWMDLKLVLQLLCVELYLGLSGRYRREAGVILE